MCNSGWPGHITESQEKVIVKHRTTHWNVMEDIPHSDQGQSTSISVSLSPAEELGLCDWDLYLSFIPGQSPNNCMRLANREDITHLHSLHIHQNQRQKACMYISLIHYTELHNLTLLSHNKLWPIRSHVKRKTIFLKYFQKYFITYLCIFSIPATISKKTTNTTSTLLYL